MRALVLALLIPAGAVARTLPPVPDGRAAMPQPACTATAPLPADYASFAHPVPAAESSGVFLGEAATLDLGPGTHFIVPPGHVPGADAFGGMAGFDINAPGTYRVAVGAPVWIDVIRGTAPVGSIAHAHGPACTAVKKLVDFTLTPGHYTLQISGSATSSVTFQIAKLR